ncbi:MAG: AAA family ATPase [candidate division Zixibacteria bacterium]|nr:AAA family ATPase [candidate division Zixibacteria bacterium]
MSTPSTGLRTTTGIGISGMNATRAQTETKTDQADQSVLPFLPWQGDVPFPLGVVSDVVRSVYSLNVLSRAEGEHPLFWVARAAAEPDRLRAREALPNMGVVCRLLSSRLLGQGQLRVDFEGLFRARLGDLVATEPLVQVQVERINDRDGNVDSTREKVDTCYNLLLTLLEQSGRYPLDLARLAEASRDAPGRFADQIGAALHASEEAKWRLVQMTSPAERLDSLAELLRGEIADSEHSTVPLSQSGAVGLPSPRSRVERADRRRSPDRAGWGSNELDGMAEQIGHAGLPVAVARRARSELERLQQISTASAEYTEIRNYIDWLIHIPWTATAHERTNIDEIRRVLEESFYGQRKAKDRICEYLSVMHRTGHPAPNVLCLVGAAGIGKTYLGKAVAKALRRPVITLNLGLLRSEGVLKGNRRTYPGAMPGRILRQLRAIEVANPVCLLEEVDRLSAEDSRPDLSAIVLEIIDPENNRDFADHYMEFPIDLSRILFIATATDQEDIPEMITERLEFVELPGYLLEDKVEIAFKHLWPRQLAAHGLPPDEFSVTVAAVQRIIREYTLEAGLGNLNKLLEVICRNLAAQRAGGQRGFVRVGAQQIEKMLGTPVFIPEKAETKPEIGVAMGVAWTQTGGDIMLIEALKMRGSGTVISTGSLGEVMRESIQAAHSYVRSRADWLGIAHTDFSNHDIHVHFPSGAIPKDGPSAGITISVVIASVMSERPIRNDFAMTGEVSLRGKVLPVGGIKEKVAAAHRVGIHKIIVPRQNVKDLQDVPRRIAKEMTYVPVETVDEVFAAVLLDFDPAKASLEKLLRMEMVRKHAGRRSRPRPKARARAKPRAKLSRKRARGRSR